MFKTKDDLTHWALEQFNKYGIRQPGTLTEKDIKDGCPEVPSWAITQHVEERDNKDD